MRDGKILELEVREIIDRALPASVLSGVCLFQPDHLGQTHKLGYEIDHLMHFSSEGIDHLVLIECKAQAVELRGQAPNKALRQWVVCYKSAAGETREKYLKTQLDNQAKALLGSLFQGECARKIRIHGWVVSSDKETPTPPLVDAPAIEEKPTYQLFSLNTFREMMAKVNTLANALKVDATRLRPLRVMQSDILRRVRHGLIVPELGHPEVGNGLRYVARCRERLDAELMKFFAPTQQGRWVINGAAGMGKTVLLAYAAAVFASERAIQEDEDRGPTLVSWDKEAEERKLPPKGKRNVVLLGLNTKQCEILERECARFHAEFERLAKGELLAYIRPKVVRWSENMEISADVLLVDEAHDLSSAGQAKIREWWLKDQGQRYLVLACDRHQKLRLVGEHATILERVSFSGCSTRLTRNYRSPSPVYGAALALMFRWFGQGGKKVLPSRTELDQAFGFDVGKVADWPTKAGDMVRLKLRNDSHPANYWSFTVARHTDWRMTYRWIEEWGLEADQVLWVRFEHTDTELDHVGMPCVQMRDLCMRDPDRVIDAHIKGREFPVVVIEGLPAEGADAEGGSVSWQWRRRLYLCASRASCFLIFVYPGPDESPTRKAWNEELLELLRSCSAPRNRDESSSKFWELEFRYPERVLKPEVFSEIEESAVKASATLQVPKPIQVAPMPAAVVLSSVGSPVVKTVVAPQETTKVVPTGDQHPISKATAPKAALVRPAAVKPPTALKPTVKACGMSPRMIARHLKTDAAEVLAEARKTAEEMKLSHNPSLDGDLSPLIVDALYKNRNKPFPTRKQAAILREETKGTGQKEASR